jgi:hypothetical protein
MHKKQIRQFDCNYCSLVFNSAKKLEIHLNSLHRCEYCDFTSDALQIISHQHQHMRGILPKSHMYQRGYGIKNLNPYPFTEIKAFKGFFRTYRYRSKLDSESKIIVVRDFFNRFKSTIRKILLLSVDECKHVKLQVSLLCKFTRAHASVDDEDPLVEKTTQYFNSNLKIILSPVYISKAYNHIVNELDLFVEFFEKNGSGWVLEEVQGCDIRIAKFKIFKGGCDADVPTVLKCKGGIVNPQTSGKD